MNCQNNTKKLVADVIPAQINVTSLQRILQNLLAERVSIRDLPTVLEGIAEAANYTKNVSMITEHVRSHALHVKFATSTRHMMASCKLSH